MFAPFAHGDVVNAEFSGHLFIRQAPISRKNDAGAYR
jgi:hypothetical protein